MDECIKIEDLYRMSKYPNSYCQNKEKRDFCLLPKVQNTNIKLYSTLNPHFKSNKLLHFRKPQYKNNRVVSLSKLANSINIDKNLKIFQEYYNNKNTNQNIIQKYLNTSSFSSDKYQVSHTDYSELSKEIKKHKKNRYETSVNVITDKEDFISPRSSLKIINTNRALSRQINNIISTSQAEKFDVKMKTFISKQRKMELMPRAKITILAPKEIKIGHLVNESDNFSNINITDERVRLKIIKENKYYYCKYLPQKHTVPNTRCQPTFTRITHLMHTFLLFGGLSTCSLFDFWLYNTKKNSWNKLIPIGEQFQPRYGHTSVYYKGLVFIFGGVILKNKMYPTEDIIIYNMFTNTIKAGVFKKTQKFYVPWRRNHIAQSIGSSMIVHGGINDNSDNLKPMSEIMCLDLVTLSWSKLNIEYRNIRKYNDKILHLIPNFSKKPTDINLAYHSSCLVLSHENQINEIHSLYRFGNPLIEKPESDDKKNKIKFEGIYIFGGIDETGEISDTLYILHLGVSPLVFFRPTINGKGPSKRYSCSMSYFLELGLVIIYGGKNSECLDDMFLLDIYNFTWIEVNLFGMSYDPRAEMVMEIDKDKLYIFGGCNEKAFLSSKVMCVDLDIIANRRKKKILDYAKEEKVFGGSSEKTANQALYMLENGIDIPDTFLPLLSGIS